MRKNIDNAKLVDISTVSVDKNLPERERCLEYIRQIKNPLRYISGKFTITAVHPDNGKTLEDCLRGMMA